MPTLGALYIKWDLSLNALSFFLVLILLRFYYQ